MRLVLLAAAAVAASVAMASAEDFIEGVYFSSADNCSRAQADGLEAVLGEGDLALTASGLHGYEYHCDFLQVLKGVRTPGWTVTALCEEPGFASSDIITIMQRSEGELELVSLALRSSEDDAAGSLETYVHCPGVELP